MSKDPIAWLRELEQAATKGLWSSVNIGDEDEPMLSVKAERIAGRGPTHEVAICATGDSSQEMETANARLIAAARNLLPVLVDVLVEAMQPAYNVADGARRGCCFSLEGQPHEPICQVGKALAAIRLEQERQS